MESTAKGLPRSRARNPGVVKIPAPITFATTTLVAVSAPTDRARVAAGCSRGAAGMVECAIFPLIEEAKR